MNLHVGWPTLTHASAVTRSSERLLMVIGMTYFIYPTYSPKAIAYLWKYAAAISCMIAERLNGWY